MSVVKLPSGTMYEVKTLLGKGDSNAKLSKSDKAGKGYLTVGLSLSPANESGYEMCSSRSAGCTKACLYTSGHGAFQTVKNARMAKTIFFKTEPYTFINRLQNELVKHCQRADKAGKLLACRLNIVSDVKWEEYLELDFDFPNVQFYDYTKHRQRMLNYLSGQLPKNYHLTFSRSENNDKHCLDVLEMGGNVTVVFDKGGLPDTWNGYKVINGDETDLRFLDEKGVVVGLKAKGQGRKDQSGFVLSRYSLAMISG